MTGSTGPPILILGIMQRCGGNFLLNLLRQHPDCSQPAPIWEDFLVSQAGLLHQYARRVARRWDPNWGVDDGAEADLLAHVGDGALSFLAARTEGRVVSRTPGVESLDRFFDVFPRAKLVILVRDGRAVVESGVRSFGWLRDEAIHRWAEAAATIRAFQAAHQDESDRFAVVRYEDLCTDLAPQLRKLFAFLELDADAYDFGAAATLPIHGSSELADEAGKSVHWEPTPKTSAFDPLSRFEHWTRADHERFNHVAGDELQHFGYDCPRYEGARMTWAIRNILLDLAWVLRRRRGRR